MTDYKTLYFALFAAAADAVEALEQDNAGLAKQILIAAQQKAEDDYICAEE